MPRALEVPQDDAPPLARRPLSDPDLTGGDLGDGGDPVEGNERLPAAPMPAPVKMPPETPEVLARAKSAAEGVKLADVPEQDRLAHHTAWVAQNANIAPEQGTIATDLAPAPSAAGYTASHLPAVQQQVNQQKMADDLARAPGVASYAAQSPAHAAAIKDDTSILADIENVIAGDYSLPGLAELAFTGKQGAAPAPGWFRALRDGLREQRANGLSVLKAEGNLSPEGEKLLAELSAPSEKQPGDDSTIGKAVEGVAGMAPYMAGAILSGSAGKALAGKPGEVGALAAFNLWETFGPAARSLYAAKKPDGSPMYSDDEVRSLAILSAAAQTAAMTAVQEATGHVFGAPLARAETNAAVTSWLNSGGFNLVKGFAARYSFHAVVGAATVAAQHSIHAAVEELGQNSKVGSDWSRPFREFLPAFKDGMESMLLPAALGPGLEVAGRPKMPVVPKPETLAIIGYRQVAEQEQAKLESMISNAEQSALVKRSPAQAQAALAPATEQHGAADTAFIDKEAFDKAHGPLAEAVAASQGGNYPEAHALGAPVAIPLEAHLASVADGKARELLPATKLNPESKSPNELSEEVQPSLAELLGLKAKAEGKEAPPAEEVVESGPPLPDKEIPSPLDDALPSMKEQRAAIRAQVDAEAEADPAGRALKILQDDGGWGTKIDRKFANENFDKKTIAALDALGVLKHGAIEHPNDLANRLGFANAHELAHAVMNPDLSEQGREIEVERRLLAKFPDANKSDIEIRFAQANVELKRLKEELLNTQSRLKVAGAAELAGAKAAHAKAIADLKAAQDAAVSGLKDDAQKTTSLLQGALGPGEDDLKAAKQEAEAGVNAKAIGDIDPRYYLAAERAAANRAAVASAKGDIQAALDAKRQQVQSMFAWNEAKRVQKEMAKARAGLTAAYSPEARALLARSGRAYLDGIDIAMEAVGVKKPLAETNWWAQGKDADRAAALAQTFAQMDADGYPRPPGVEAALSDLVNPAGGKFRDWSKLTPGEARLVAGGIKGMQIAARAVREISDGAERIAFNKANQQIIEETASAPDVEPVKYTSGNPKPEMTKARQFLNSVSAQLLRFKENVRDLGPLASRIFFDQMIAARTYKEDLLSKVAPFFDENWKKVPKDIAARAYEPTNLSKWFPLPEGQKPLEGVPRTWLYALHLHNMSEGNMDRVLGGPLTLLDPAATRAARAKDPGAAPVKWQTAWKQDDVNHVLYENPATRLTRAEADFLQAVADHETKGDPSKGVPSLWELIKAKQEERFGIAPPKVAGVPRTIQFADGTSKDYEGGYHHLAEDRGATPRSEKVATDSVSDFFGKHYQFAQTSNGFAKAREATAQYMTDMTWDSIPAHITQVAHDLAFGDWVRGAGRLALNDEFRANADRVLGTGRADQLRDQIGVVARGQSNSIIKGSEGVWNAIAWSKNAGVTGIVGYSIPMMLGQLSHIPGMFAGGKVSIVHGLPALLSTLNPVGVDANGLHLFPGIEAARQLSSEVRHRDANATAIMGDVRTALDGERQGLKKLLTPVDLAKQHAGVFLHMVDSFLSAWAFNASRAEGISRGMTDEEAEHYANGVVQDIMPDHSIETAAPILVDRKLGAATLIMHGFGNTLYNMAYRDVVRPFSVAADAGDRMGMARAGLKGIQHGAMLAVLGTVGKLLWGHGPEKEESWAAWFTRNALAAPGMLVPYLGGAAEWAANTTTRALPKWWIDDGEGKHAAASPRYSEMQAPGFAIAQKIHELGTHLESTRETGDQKTIQTMGAIMQLLHVPPQPLTRQGSYLNDVRAGRVNPRGPGDVLSGLLGYSTRKGADRTLPTIAQDQLSPPGTSQ